jgi:hypothetical protein
MVFSPLDEELELVAGKLTPRGHEQLVRLSSYVPFEQAVELFEEFTGIHVSKDLGQRYTEEAGAVYEELQTEEVEELQKKRPKVKAISDKLQVSADGCMVPLVHGVWAEVKTLVIGEVQPAVLKDGERVVRTRNLSYFSRKTGAEEFERLSLGEMHRRGVENAKAVAAVYCFLTSRPRAVRLHRDPIYIWEYDVRCGARLKQPLCTSGQDIPGNSSNDFAIL